MALTYSAYVNTKKRVALPRLASFDAKTISSGNLTTLLDAYKASILTTDVDADGNKIGYQAALSAYNTEQTRLDALFKQDVGFDSSVGLVTRTGTGVEGDEYVYVVNTKYTAYWTEATASGAITDKPTIYANLVRLVTEFPIA